MCSANHGWGGKLLMHASMAGVRVALRRAVRRVASRRPGASQRRLATALRFGPPATLTSACLCVCAFSPCCRLHGPGFACAAVARLGAADERRR